MSRSHISVIEYEKPKHSYNKSQIVSVIELLIAREGISGTVNISVIVLGSRSIKEINKRFRGKDKDAKSLSFPLAGKDKFIIYKEENFLGDIIINIDKISLAKNFKKEILRNIIHSFLHLLSYDHNNDKNEAIMGKKEKKLLGELSGAFWENKKKF